MHTSNSRANSREDRTGGAASGGEKLQAGIWHAGMPPMAKREPSNRGNSGAHNGGKGRNKRPLLKVAPLTCLSACESDLCPGLIKSNSGFSVSPSLHDQK